MKEITKAKFINTWASEWDERTGWKVSEEYHKQFSEQLEYLINQEVEKRIEERQDEMEAGFLERWIRTFNLYSDTSAFCNGYRRMREERDRLVSQKTDNLKENNNNGSTN